LRLRSTIIKPPSRKKGSAMTIASILAGKGEEVVTVAADTTIWDVVALLHDRRIGAVLVMDGDQPTGIVSERDVVRCLHQRGTDILSATAAAVMTSPVVVAAPGDTVASAMALMTERRIRHLPVMNRGKLVGLVSIGDLVKRRIDDAEHETQTLKTYITAS
jgi:CBS domain-containing protein